jgi:heme exporter protein D
MPDLDMSPYAAFVWPAWGISALVLAAVVARAVTSARRWTAELRRLEDEDRSRLPSSASDGDAG